MKLSARNQIPGTITEVKPGATHNAREDRYWLRCHRDGLASITNEAATELGLKSGMKAMAVIKASDVTVGV